MTDFVEYLRLDVRRIVSEKTEFIRPSIKAAGMSTLLQRPSIRSLRFLPVAPRSALISCSVRRIIIAAPFQHRWARHTIAFFMQACTLGGISGVFTALIWIDLDMLDEAIAESQQREARSCLLLASELLCNGLIDRL